MFGVSGNHILLFIIFLAIVLIIFGPGKLPDVGAGMGKAIREFRKASTDVKDSINSAVHDPVEPEAPRAPAPSYEPEPGAIPVAVKADAKPERSAAAKEPTRVSSAADRGA